VTSEGCPVVVSLEENGPLLARYKIEYHMTIPAGLDENGGDAWQRLDGGKNASRRTDETRDLVITSLVTLRKGARAVEMVTRFENTCRNHRLRVMFPARLRAKTCHVESAFDVVEREIDHGPDSPWADAVNPTFPMHRFVDVSDGKVGLAIMNDGLREYEVTSGVERTIAVTLLRAFEIALTTVSKRWEHHPEMTLSQCPGAHEFRYAIYPHAGTWDKAEVFREAERLSLPLEPAQAGAHGGSLPKRHGFLSIEPANLVVSAVKRAEDGKGLVLRVFNPTGKPVNAVVKFDRKIRAAEEITLEELPLRKLTPRGAVLKLDVAAKKIVTLKVRL
jgi:alpha-mannosidase